MLKSAGNCILKISLGESHGISGKNRKVFAFAQKYLEENLPVGLTKADLEKYYEPRQFKNLGDVYDQFIMSVQNRQAMPNIIKFNNEHLLDKLACLTYVYCWRN